MPEIKNTFVHGKMNKDLDKRLIPKGQYINAMNVEVTTSEDSDVGTVQNIYGNIGIDGNNLVPSDNVCVGSIVDDATDSLYWLTATDKTEPGSHLGEGAVINNANIIFRHNKNNSPLVDPVFVDVHQVLVDSTLIETSSSTTNIFTVPPGLNLRVGMSVRLVNQLAIDSMGYITTIAPNPIDLTQILVATSQSGTFDTYDYIEFNLNTTGWDTDTLITGINIIDDMLFWTDNENEPKKINIPRSKEGTFLYSSLVDIKHTDLYVNNVNEGPILESHITVIKPKPTTRINLEMKSSTETMVNTGVYGSIASMNGRVGGPTSELLQPGDEITTSPDSLDTVSFDGTKRFDYKVGDIILFKFSSATPTLLQNFPIYDYHIKTKLYDIGNNVFTSSLSTQIKLIVLDVNHEGYPGLIGAASGYQWAIQKQLHEDQLFELKFPRFSYRWKFEDGEYSTFAPWSDVGFLPGEFKYLPKEGFNIGMVNSLKELILYDFVAPDIPLDAIHIDLLYKESDSPNVYVIDTLKPNDPPPIDGSLGLIENPWQSNGSQGAINTNHAILPRGKYKITSETIFASVSPNQLIRNWDVVPRKALAQDIIGNRLIYANYVKNFNLEPAPGWKFKQDLTVSFRSHDISKWEKKSVKTIRDYQVGIAYLDEYGRETPVFTNNDSVVSIPKLFSSKSNILYSKINHFAPQHASAYKFYVKENSRKYYNLAMDRWYDAEDGDIWLSFNSHDRNKVDEETFLYLKRGHDGGIVKDNYKYKILDIKNEAPEFIKNIRKQFGIKPNDPTDVNTWNIVTGLSWWALGDKILDSSSSFPKVGSKTFTINDEIVDNSSWAVLNNLNNFPNTKLRVRFLKYPSTTTAEHRDHGTFSFDESPSETSAWYKIDKVVGGSAMGSNYMINLNKELENDCLFVTNTTGTTVEDYIAIEIAQEEAENLPEFDGRFFVKVLRDEGVEKNIISGTAYTVEEVQPLYFFDQPVYTGTTGTTWTDTNSVGLQFYKDEYNGSMAPTDDADHATVKDPWEGYFGEGFEQVAGAEDGPKWFIDNLKFAGSMVGLGNLPSGLPVWGYPPFQLTDGTPGTGRGIDNTNNTIDISFSGYGIHSPIQVWPSVDPILAPTYLDSLQNSLYWFGRQFENPVFGHILGEQWDEAVGYNQYTGLVDNFKAGSKFKFSEDDDNVIYTIVAVEVFNRWNYLDEDLWLDGTSYYGPLENDYALGYDGGINQYGTTFNLIHNLQDRLNDRGGAGNRRISWRLHLDKSIQGNYDPTTSDCDESTDDCSIEFLHTQIDDVINRTSITPAIWETEPKEKVDIDIYYEASKAYPMYITPLNIANVFSRGDKIRAESVLVNLDVIPGKEAEIRYFSKWTNGVISIKNINSTSSFTLPQSSLIRIYDKNNDANYIELTAFAYQNLSGNTVEIFVETNTHKWGRTLDWFNSYSFGNGVESDTIRDDFNQVEIGSGVTVSTTVGWQFEEERLKNGLIFSGLYNAKTGLNNLNQFIEAENITKEVNPSYGSIQKLHTRDSDLVTFCEDKVLKILANKDALYNADESPNLISSKNVLGQTLPFIGDYGISKNPESFARENFRSYFADKKRGAVLRLSRDGITPISENGMKDWFRDNLKDATDQRLYGSYDNHKSHYNLTPVETGKTVVFNETSKGWTSFKSFIPEGGESMNNDYFTFKRGQLFQHHIGAINTFYNEPVTDSSLNFVFNEAPSVVKSFTTINYEGTQSRVIQRDDDSEYINLNPKLGWYVSNIQTDKQEGKVKEFIEKEGKWFNYILGESTSLSNIDTSEFSYQGISSLSQPALLITDQLHYGCTDLFGETVDGFVINIDTGDCGGEEIIPPDA